ncbi:hypothetical protein P9112_014581 [Eukaryota sp. TZLM1-RC]
MKTVIFLTLIALALCAPQPRSRMAQKASLFDVLQGHWQVQVVRGNDEIVYDAMITPFDETLKGHVYFNNTETSELEDERFITIEFEDKQAGTVYFVDSEGENPTPAFTFAFEETFNGLQMSRTDLPEGGVLQVVTPSSSAIHANIIRNGELSTMSLKKVIVQKPQSVLARLMPSLLMMGVMIVPRILQARRMQQQQPTTPATPAGEQSETQTTEPPSQVEELPDSEETTQQRTARGTEEE